MDETYISFYLRTNRIHVFIDALRGIGCPARICFMIGENGKTLLLVPYKKRDFKSHYISKEVYKGCDSLEINSFKLCRIIAGIHGWDTSHSYRVPGIIHSNLNAVIIDLEKAFLIS